MMRKPKPSSVAAIYAAHGAEYLAKYRVRVYWNLQKKCWSIMTVHYRRLIGHAKELVLNDCTFVVYEAGRQRVLREKRKNVHAFVEGFLSPKKPDEIRPNLRISYDPYRDTQFKVADQLVTSSCEVCFYSDKEVRAKEARRWATGEIYETK